MSFCPVPHSAREVFWLSAGASAAYLLLKTTTRPNANARRTTQHEYSTPDQQKRYAAALASRKKRFVDIEALYEPGYLKNKRVLITGANRGLGLALAVEMVQHGARVIVAGRSTSKELENTGVEQIICGVDVTDAVGMRKLVSALSAPVDILINNAGYFYEPEETLESLNFEEELKMIDICGVGPLRVTSALYNAKLLAPSSKVVIITSQAGSVEWRFTQNPEGHDYGHHMSRSACNMGGVLLSQELKAAGIPVLLLHPGFNKTDMTAKYSHIWEVEGAVDVGVGAKRVLHEVGLLSMETTGRFINAEDGLQIPW